ncbi:MAG: cyclic nucleotide-binding domain-containing protein [Thermodesulfobacteriota bacterium]
MDRTEFLSKVPLFALLGRRDLKRLAELAQEESYAPGQYVFRESERDDSLFVVVDGEVEVVRDLDGEHAKRLRRLDAYSYFGEMALINDLVHTASVRALGPVRLLRLKGFDLRQELERHPFLAVELLQVLSRRIVDTERRLMKVLEGLLPVCASCKSIRDDDGRWVPLEEYLHLHSDASLTHGICPVCAQELYPGLVEKKPSP